MCLIPLQCTEVRVGEVMCEGSRKALLTCCWCIVSPPCRPLRLYPGPSAIWQLGTHKRAKAKRELCQNLLRAAQRKK